MAYSLGPLQINPSSNEPFLRLRKHPNIIITPPRRTDPLSIISVMNDERVIAGLRDPVYPYTEEHALRFIEVAKQKCDQGVEELSDAERGQAEVILTECPVRFIREVQKDGSDIFLGDVEFSRCPHETFLEGTRVDSKSNFELPAGHPDIVWTFTYFLASSHHGRGIMSDAVDTIIHAIGRRYLGARHIVGATRLGNVASVKVFTKNGFTLKRQLIDTYEIRGKLHSINIFEHYFGEEA